jgi:SSS family solute:Na+ symporter
MASRDLLGRRVESGGSAVGVERWFLFGAGFVVFALHEAVERFSLPIFDVAAFSFSGYVTLFPTLALTLLWRRFTATAALTSMAAGLVTLAAAQAGWLDSRGFLPVAPALVAAALVAFLASWFTRPPSPAQIAHAFGDRER